MLRVRRSAARRGCTVLRFYASSKLLFQMQSRERILSGTHGAGLLRHVPMSQQGAAGALPTTVSGSSTAMAAPAADLFRTKVHGGTGTSEKDPYVRTLPNHPSREPESSVAQNTAALAPTVDELAALPRRWGTMHYWIGDSHPRLPIYLQQLIVRDAPPLSPAAESLLTKFEATVIPQLVADDRERQKLVELWQTTVMQVESLTKMLLFDRAAFEAQLSRVCEDATRHMRVMTLSGPDGALAVEALRRRAILRRNQTIEAELLQLCGMGSYLGFGDAIWQVFFCLVEAREVELFGADAEASPIRTAWEAILREDAVTLPEVTAPVALYLTLICVQESPSLVSEAESVASRTLLPSSSLTEERHHETLFALLNPVIKRRFVMTAVSQLLEFPCASPLSVALHKKGMADLGREVALCEAAISGEDKLLEDDVADAVARFENTSEVKTLLSTLMGGTEAAVGDTVGRIFSVARGTAVNWDAVMQSVDWTSNWRRLATELLRDRNVLAAVHKQVKNAIGAKGMTKRLFTEEYAEQLQQIMNAREERVNVRKLRVSRVVEELSSHKCMDAACEVLREMGVNMTELDEAAAALRKGALVKRPRVGSLVVAQALEAVAARHLNWVRAGVIRSTAASSLEALRWMLHIFVRLAYVPQAGAAAIAQRSRRRIGQIGTEPHQFNVPTEVGFVEHYDNLQYKRYDWQGWYQRMVDIHNRNVSLRCRIDDLKRLDAHGKPFVDMQTERRLRILAQERVGMGVLKLDADKYEDQSDNMTYGTVKLAELLADARKAQLGEEYWPSVELKVRRPSGQSKMHYSLIDHDRIEKRSMELYEKYRDAKKRSLFVTPMDMWLEVKGVQVRKNADSSDAHGYTVDALQDALDEKDSE